MIDDCVIVGGGIIGLSLAAELHQQGLAVSVLDRKKTETTASWAAGGILPPPVTRALHDPLEQLRDLSHRLYPTWCQQLSVESGLSVSYDVCGGVYLGRTVGERVSLHAALEQWRCDGIRAEEWTTTQLRTAEPELGSLADSSSVYYLPDEATVRPTQILAALRNILERAAVPIQDVELLGWGAIEDDAVELQTSAGSVRAGHCCITAGSWTPLLLHPLGLGLPVEPRRGQMVLWKLATPPVTRVINEGPRYLIARPDGHLLAGSTVEDVGYDGSTTVAGRGELIEFARSLLPMLAGQEPVRAWAGLRPASLDGKPYLGRVPGQSRISLACGHFRSGIHLAPATARLMRQLICGESPDLELDWFSPLR